MNTNDSKDRQFKIALVVVILILAIGCLIYHFLMYHKLEQTSALFIGFPTILSILFACTPRAKSVTGIIFKGITLIMLISGIFWGEGFVCVLFASPIFYAVGFIIGYAIEKSKKWFCNLRMFVIVPLMFSSFEGITPEFSFNRMNAVCSTRIIQASPVQILKRLSETPKFIKPLPAFLKVGFPRPIECFGEGLKVGDRRIIHFAGGEGKPGDLTLEITKSTSQLVRFTVISDTSHISHWLKFIQSDVYLDSVENNQTKVRWVLHYERRLDPAWYFSPLQKYATKLATDVLINNLMES